MRNHPIGNSFQGNEKAGSELWKEGKNDYGAMVVEGKHMPLYSLVISRLHHIHFIASSCSFFPVEYIVRCIYLAIYPLDNSNATAHTSRLNLQPYKP